MTTAFIISYLLLVLIQAKSGCKPGIIQGGCISGKHNCKDALPQNQPEHYQPKETKLTKKETKRKSSEVEKKGFIEKHYKVKAKTVKLLQPPLVLTESELNTEFYKLSPEQNSPPSKSASVTNNDSTNVHWTAQQDNLSQTQPGHYEAKETKVVKKDTKFKTKRKKDEVKKKDFIEQHFKVKAKTVKLPPPPLVLRESELNTEFDQLSGKLSHLLSLIAEVKKRNVIKKLFKVKTLRLPPLLCTDSELNTEFGKLSPERNSPLRCRTNVTDNNRTNVHSTVQQGALPQNQPEHYEAKETEVVKKKTKLKTKRKIEVRKKGFIEKHFKIKAKNVKLPLPIVRTVSELNSEFDKLSPERSSPPRSSTTVTDNDSTNVHSTGQPGALPQNQPKHSKVKETKVLKKETKSKRKMAKVKKKKFIEKHFKAKNKTEKLPPPPLILTESELNTEFDTLGLEQTSLPRSSTSVTDKESKNVHSTVQQDTLPQTRLAHYKAK